MEQQNEWEALTNTVREISSKYPHAYETVWEYYQSTQLEEDLKVFAEHVPKLLDAYAELWEMTQAMMQAWEQMQVEKDKLKIATADEVAKFTSPFLKG